MSKARVLLVDDDERLRQSLAHRLGRWYEVTEAADAEAALAILRERGVSAFDVIVSDFAMGGAFDGLELMAIVRDYFSSLKRVLISGDPNPAQFVPHVDAGVMHGFLPKPCTYLDVQAEIERVLAG